MSSIKTRRKHKPIIPSWIYSMLLGGGESAFIIMSRAKESSVTSTAWLANSSAVLQIYSLESHTSEKLGQRANVYLTMFNFVTFFIFFFFTCCQESEWITQTLCHNFMFQLLYFIMYPFYNKPLWHIFRQCHRHHSNILYCVTIQS